MLRQARAAAPMMPRSGGSIGFESDEENFREANSGDPPSTPPPDTALQQSLCDRHALLSVFCFPIMFGQLWQRHTRLPGSCLLVVVLTFLMPLLITVIFTAQFVPAVSGAVPPW